VNADIVCEHGNLARSGAIRGKRRVIDKAAWKVLRTYYPQSRSLKTKHGECWHCCDSFHLAKEEAQRHCATIKQAREAEIGGSPALSQLSARRVGFPQHMARGDAVVEMTKLPMPLMPGLYHLLPKSWLKTFRHYIRDHQAPRPVAPDSTCLLCDAHQLPLVPPHVMSFLAGERGTLLQSMTDEEKANQTVCEILTIDEYEAVASMYGSTAGDFNLSFAIEPDRLTVQWGGERCLECDPGHDSHVRRVHKQIGHKQVGGHKQVAYKQASHSHSHKQSGHTSKQVGHKQVGHGHRQTQSSHKQVGYKQTGHKQTNHTTSKQIGR